MGGYVTFVVAVFLIILGSTVIGSKPVLFPVAPSGTATPSPSAALRQFCQTPTAAEQQTFKFDDLIDNVTKKGDNGVETGGRVKTQSDLKESCGRGTEQIRHVFGPQTTTYKIIKKNVPIDTELFQPDSCHADYIKTIKIPPVNGKNYKVYYPEISGELKLSRQYLSRTRNPGDVSDPNLMYFIDYNLVFLVEEGNQTPMSGTDIKGNTKIGREGRDLNFILADVYQSTDSTWTLPDEAFKCGQNASPTPSPSPQANQVVNIPDKRSPSSDNNQLQLDYFLLGSPALIAGVVQNGWGVSCKPAIYLYSKEKTLVNVKVSPQGYLTMSIPQYDLKNGWTVEAYPDGSIVNRQSSIVNRTFPYLYYESKIRDEVINKPTKGWVVKFDELEPLYKNILPKLGLSPQQTQDFITYWDKALPYSPYYFVGIMDRDNVNQIEPLTITPKPDSINRVRIYFERLDDPKQVEAPQLTINDERLTINDSFRVIEWGGMVKQDKDHPFTCSQ